VLHFKVSQTHRSSIDGLTPPLQGK